MADMLSQGCYYLVKANRVSIVHSTHLKEWTYIIATAAVKQINLGLLNYVKNICFSTSCIDRYIAAEFGHKHHCEV